MKKLQLTFSTMLPALALTATLFCAGPLMHAQSSPVNSQAQQQPNAQPDDQNTTQKSFTGTVVKSGDKLILTDSASKTTYQLDDQMKAQDFVNKNVKVTGVLDPATGTIRVSAIDPM